MKTLGILGILTLLLSTVILALPDSAEAARMGGGRSFGSRPSMSQPAPSRSVQTPTQNRAAQPGAAATPARNGMFGGMGGILGGLLAGTLLGSLLSGNGMAGGGGGFMDLILLAVLVFIGWKLFTRFRGRAASPAGAGAGFGSPMADNQPMARNDMSSSSGWGALSGQAFPQPADPKVDIPADFDTEDFLKGARTVYNRMQSSWDKRDLADIAQFATPAVMRELEAQAAADPNPSRTEIMTVNTKLLGVEDEGDTRRAQVYFDVLMREDPSAPTPENVREVWHFVRTGQNGSWKLDGIQQVA